MDIPDGADLRNVMFFAMIFGILAFTNKFMRSQDTMLKQGVEAAQMFSGMFALGIAIGIFPFIGTFLDDWFKSHNWAPTTVALLGFFLLAANKFGNFLPTWASGDKLLLVISAVCGFAATKSTDLVPIMDALSQLVIAGLTAVKAGLDVVSKIIDLVMNFLKQR